MVCSEHGTSWQFGQKLFKLVSNDKQHHYRSALSDCIDFHHRENSYVRLVSHHSETPRGTFSLQEESFS